MKQLARPLRFFAAVTSVLALLALLIVFADWHANESLYFVVCLAFAAFSAAWQTGEPALDGTPSLGIVFVIIGIADFTLPQNLVLGLVVVLAGAFYVRPTPRRLIYQLAGILVSVCVGFAAFQLYGGQTGGSPWWPLIPAVVFFAMTHSFPAAVWQAYEEGGNLIEVWHEAIYWSLPHYVVGTTVAVVLAPLHRTLGWGVSLPALPFLLVAYRWSSRYLAAARARRQGHDVVASMHQRTLEALGLAISARFRATKGQLSRAQKYCLKIADDLGLPKPARDALRAASVLHDVGMLAVPEQIICKAQRLSQEEFEKVKIHPIVGASIIQQAQFPYPVHEIVRGHHERWDGNGYPDGLSDEMIPIGARILAVVDCVVALTSDRPYRQAVSMDRALGFVASQAGQAYDPEVVEALLNHASELEAETLTATQGLHTGDAPEPDFVASISDARRETSEVYELAQELGQSLSLADTLSSFCRRLRAIINFDALVVYISRDGLLVAEYVSGTPELNGFRIPFGHGVCGKVAQNGLIAFNAETSSELEGLPAQNLASVTALPLSGSDGTLGVLGLYKKDRAGFTRNDLRLLEGIQGMLATAVDKALRFESATESAVTDQLTGLPNARSMFQRLETELARCRRSEGTFTVLLCDLNGFKGVNDRFGHLAGNNVLKAAARAMQKHCREYDYVARMGGDEFVIVLPGLPDAAVEGRIRHLDTIVQEAAEVACPGAGTSLSCGQARYPTDGTEVETLLSVADHRMYEMKNRAKHATVQGFAFDWVRKAAG